MGNNNSILYNSKYYTSVLFFGVLLAILAIGFNLWLIPKYGLQGAAIASFSAFFIYNSLKLYYVKSKFGLQPFTIGTLKVFLLIVVIAIIFSIVPFSFQPIINIGVKSILITTLYFYLLYKWKISVDINAVIHKYLGRK
ncbi:polysaccharide biosynthesis C-terminal domain-containing protein [Maribacter litopenaei]|uniref:polysaccharide biosynthesis C-terminal domain-containing protein n=1 Tax=Maribacter litopenaei TaxID=2976127 RepID=UPI003B845FBA